MTAIQRAVVDDLGHIHVHGREGIVVLLKIETATAGVYENISASDLFIEVSGKYRVALAAGADVYTRQVVLTRAQVAQLATNQPVPFVVVDETPTSPRSLWAGLITSYGFRVAPTGAAVEEGVATSYAGASVIVQPDADTPALVVRYDGPQGNAGWSPVMSVASDGAVRKVLRITDWIGGAGTKPNTGYVAAGGVVSDIADADNLISPADITAIEAAGDAALAAIAAAEDLVVDPGGTIDTREDAAVAVVEAAGGDQVARVAATPGSGQYETKAAGDAAGLATGAHFIVPLAPGLGFEVYRDTGVGTSTLVNTMTDMQALAASTATISSAVAGLAETADELMRFTGTSTVIPLMTAYDSRILKARDVSTGALTGAVYQREAWAVPRVTGKTVSITTVGRQTSALWIITPIWGQSNAEAKAEGGGLPVLSTSERYPGAAKTFVGGAHSYVAPDTNSLGPLVNIVQESPGVGCAEGAIEYARANGYDLTNITFIGISHGSGGKSLPNLTSGPDFEAWIDQFEAIKTLADAAGATVICPVIGLIQGEAATVDSVTYAARRTEMLAFRTAADTRIRSVITAQTTPIHVVLTQTSYNVLRVYNSINGQVARAERDLTLESDYWHIALPAYAIELDTNKDGSHRNSLGHWREGWRHGQAMAELMFAGRRPQVLDVKSATYRVNEAGEHEVRVTWTASGFLVGDDYAKFEPTTDWGFEVQDDTGTLTVSAIRTDGPVLTLIVNRALGANPLFRSGMDYAPWNIGVSGFPGNLLNIAATNLRDSISTVHRAPTTGNQTVEYHRALHVQQPIVAAGN